MPWGTILRHVVPPALMYLGTRGATRGAEQAGEASADLSNTLADILAGQWAMQAPYQRGVFQNLANRSRQQVPQILPGGGQPPPTFDPRAGMQQPRAPMTQSVTHQPDGLPPGESVTQQMPMAHNRFPEIARLLMQQMGMKQ